MHWILMLVMLVGSILQPLKAQEESEPIPNNEFSIGMGAAFPGERDPLNIVGEDAMPVAFISANFGYRRYLAERAAIGLRLFGTVSTLTGYMVAPQSTPTVFHQRDYDATTITIALEGVFLLSKRRAVQPYLTLIGGYATGVIANNEAGSLQFRGAVGGGGLGVRIALGSRVAVAVEGLGSFGSAKWRDRPFTNSSDDHFNPSAILALATLWVRVR